MILGIDSTGLTASVALADENAVLGEISTNFKKTHSQTLMPMVDMLFKTLGISPSEIRCVACSAGPGSFTGLRIGAATAKGLAMGLNKKIVPVPALDAMAYNIFESQKLVIPIMDARRGQVYAALYRYVEGRPKRLTEFMAEPMDYVLELADRLGGGGVFTGDGTAVHWEKILSRGYTLAPAHLNSQRGGGVAVMALEMESQAIDAADFAPFYIRKSQAERELENKWKSQ